MKVVALMNLQGVQLVSKNVFGELPWREQRQVPSEGKQEHRIHARFR
jgi:hypothetical protein